MTVYNGIIDGVKVRAFIIDINSFIQMDSESSMYVYDTQGEVLKVKKKNVNWSSVKNE